MCELINNDELFTHKVSQKTDLFNYLKEELVVSMRLTNKLIKSKKLFLNNKPVKKNQRIKENDVIRIEFEDEYNNYEEEQLPLDIVYENHDIIVINKEPYRVVHPTKSHENETIANGVAAYLKGKNLNRKIRFVNRLDMNTSGLLIIAKNAYAHQYIAKQFEQDHVIKEYIAVVKGKLKTKKDVIIQPVKKDTNTGKYVINEHGKHSITEYEVIEETTDYSFVKCILKSGRTHQIRVHLASIGHPILGDSLYGEETKTISRQALHSYRLVFMLPRTKERIELIANLPEDFNHLK